MNDHEMLSDTRQRNKSINARREQMLPELIDAMHRLHRRRRVRRRIITTATPIVAIVASAALWISFGQTAGPSATKVVEGPATGSMIPQLPPVTRTSVQFARVQTDPSIVERYRAARTSRTIILDDAGLVQMLAQINRPAGLIRSEGAVWLTADVTTSAADENREWF